MLINKQKNFFFDIFSFFIYYESNIFIISSLLGIIKVFYKENVHYYIHDFFFVYNTSYFFFLGNGFTPFYKTVHHISESMSLLMYGSFLKYKVIGLGHRGYFSKNIYLFKVGYSHLVFCFVPFNIKSKKKKKKKQFHKLVSINKIELNTFFFNLKSMRVPDIYSMNGIFNRNDYYSFKKGKKSFLL